MGLLGWAARIGTDRLFIVQSAITVRQVITVNTEIAAHECLWRLPKTVFTISTHGIRSMQDAECHYPHPMDIVSSLARKESSLSDPFCSGLRVSRARWCGTASRCSARLDPRVICVSPPTRSPTPTLAPLSSKLGHHGGLRGVIRRWPACGVVDLFGGS